MSCAYGHAECWYVYTIVLSVVLLSDVILREIMLSGIMLNAVMVNVDMLNVMTPLKCTDLGPLL